MLQLKKKWPEGRGFSRNHSWYVPVPYCLVPSLPSFLRTILYVYASSELAAGLATQPCTYVKHEPDLFIAGAPDQWPHAGGPCTTVASSPKFRPDYSKKGIYQSVARKIRLFLYFEKISKLKEVMFVILSDAQTAKFNFFCRTWVSILSILYLFFPEISRKRYNIFKHLTANPQRLTYSLYFWLSDNFWTYRKIILGVGKSEGHTSSAITIRRPALF